MRKSSLSGCILAIVYCLMTTVYCWGAVIDYSSWTVNLSGITDTDTGYYNYETPKLAVSGQNVHVVWLAGGYGDVGGYSLFYRRSTDGGQTFGSVQTLVTSSSSGIFGTTNVMLAADGNTVHVLYLAPGTPGGDCLKYLRSTDTGQSFEAPKTVFSTDRYPGINGVYLSAVNGKVVIALSANDNNSPYPKSVTCVYSNDNGVSFNTTGVAYSTTIWGYTVVDMIQNGSNIYILYTVTDVNYYTSTGHLYLVSSNDGGATFNTANRVNLASGDSNFYATRIQDADYSPNLAAVGNNVYVVWTNCEQNNFDGSSTYTLRFRRSTDGGKTLGDPLTLSGAPVVSSALPSGQETIAASGNNVYVTTIFNSSTMFWRSSDSGASFGAVPVKISDGGWWPLIGIDPAAGDIYVANYYITKSSDSGTSFNGVVTPSPNTLSGWNYPSFTIDGTGVIHYLAQSHYDATGAWDVFYRRLPPAAAAGTSTKVLNLVTDSSKRRDNMQVPASPDINLSSAMTVEFWVRMDFQGDPNNWPHFQVSVAKKRVSGAGTFELGYWNGFTGFYGRLVTENSANQNYGDFLGTNIVPQELTWYHVAMTYDAGAGADNWKYYVNGNPAGSATLTGNMVMDYMPLVLGPDTSGTNGTLQFSDFRIWSRARSAGEILADMNRTLTGAESGLIAYYTFSDTTRDITGRGNDGVLMFKESFVSSPIQSRIRQLGLAFAGSGGGQVNGDMACVSGTTCNPLTFPYGSNQTLSATADTDSTFASWSGCTTVTGATCNLTMDSDKNVTVNFTAAPPVKIQGGSAAGFATLRLAYDVAAISPSSTIQARSLILSDLLMEFDLPNSVTVKGGYDSYFNPANTGITTIQGPLVFNGGPVTVEKLAIK